MTLFNVEAVTTSFNADFIQDKLSLPLAEATLGRRLPRFEAEPVLAEGVILRDEPPMLDELPMSDEPLDVEGVRGPEFLDISSSPVVEPGLAATGGRELVEALLVSGFSSFVGSDFRPLRLGDDMFVTLNYADSKADENKLG